MSINVCVKRVAEIDLSIFRFPGSVQESLKKRCIKSSNEVLQVKGFIDKHGIKYQPISARKGTLIP
jgi:hypothetical protein